MLQYIALSPILSFSFSRVLCSLSTRFPYNPSDRPFSFTAFILHFSSSNNTPVSGVEITFTFTSFHFQLALKYLISRFEKAQQRGWCVGGFVGGRSVLVCPTSLKCEMFFSRALEKVGEGVGGGSVRASIPTQARLSKQI